MKKVDISWTSLALVAAWGIGGCALDPPAQVQGPSRSPGVTVTLVGQRCDRENDPNWSSADILGLDLWIRVANTSALALFFDPSRVALSAAGSTFHPRRAGAAGVIPAGAARTVAVHFWERDGDLACDVPMALELGHSLTATGVAVTLRPISFLAAAGDR